MSKQFPSPLISRCQKLIFQKSGKKISKAQTEIYLEKFAHLMNVVIKIMDQPKIKRKKLCKK